MAQIDWAKDLQNFFNHDIGNMFKNLFMFPTKCISKMANESTVKSIVTPLCSLLISFVLCTLLTLMMGVDFGDSVLAGLVPVFYMMFIAVFVFIVMAIKGTADIMVAVNSTSIHALNFTLVYIFYALILSIFDFDRSVLVICLFTIVYGLSVGINCARQTVLDIDKGGKEAFSWWISPLIIILSLYLAIYICGRAINPLGMMGL